MKKAIKIIGYILIGILLALVIIPYVFKDEIVEGIKEAANEQLKADMEFTDVKLSLLKSFPYLYVDIIDFQIVGHAPFEGLKLIEAPTASFKVNISPLFNKKEDVIISYFELDNPNINIKILSDSLYNYDITKPSENTETSSFYLELTAYEIINGNLKYDDGPLNMEIELNNFDHQGSGNISSDIYDLTTSTQAKSLSYRLDNFNYLENIKTELNAKINIDLINNKYTLKENKLILNSLTLTGDGSIQLLDPEGLNIDVNISSPNQDFNSIVSVLPYLSQFKTYDASGRGSITVAAKGLYKGGNNPASSIYPNINARLNIADGQLKYPGAPYPIKNISSDINIIGKQGNYHDLFVDVKNINLSLNNDIIRGHLTVDNNPKNGNIKGELMADLNLNNWSNTFPIENLENLSGKINSNLKVDGLINDISSKDYNKITTSGKIEIVNLDFKTSDAPRVTSQSMTGEFDNKFFNIKSDKIILGKSDIGINGKIENPLAVLTSQLNTKGEIKIKSNKIDINEWVVDTQSKTSQIINDVNYDLPIDTSTNSGTQNITLAFDVAINNLIYDSYKLEDISSNGIYENNLVKINKLKTKLPEGDVSLDGIIINANDYMNGISTLQGDINFTSTFFDFDAFLLADADESDVSAGDSTAFFAVPANVNLNVVTDVRDAIYNNIKIKDLRGNLKVADQTLNFNEMNAVVFGGNFTLDGNYNTQEKNPFVQAKLDMSKINIKQAYIESTILPRLAPIAEFMQGAFNSILIFNGQLNNNFLPVLSTLTSSGYLETYDGVITKAPIFDQLSTKLGIDALKDLNLQNTKNWFEIINGTVELKEQFYNIKGMEIALKGTHRIDNDFNYFIKLKVPREMIRKTNIGREADRGWDWIQKEASKKGVNVTDGDYIDLLVEATGRLKSPKFKITPLGSSGKSLKEQAEDEINEKIDEAIDSVKVLAGDKQKEIKDTLTKIAKEKLDTLKGQAQEKIDKAVEEISDKAKKAIEKEVESRIDSILGEEASDSLKTKAAEIIKEKTGTSVEDIKKRLEDFNIFKKKKE